LTYDEFDVNGPSLPIIRIEIVVWWRLFSCLAALTNAAFMEFDTSADNLAGAD
jgi:hypothetical protein